MHTVIYSEVVKNHKKYQTYDLYSTDNKFKISLGFQRPQSVQLGLMLMAIN